MIIIKRLVAKIICSEFVGNFLARIYGNKIPSISVKGLIFDCTSNHVSSHTKAQIFFGIYESAELRFCKKYILPNSNIVELGSSIGFISSFIGKKKSPKSLIALEANPELIQVIRSNFELNKVLNYHLVNKAIGMSNLENVWFCKGDDNTTGYISNEKSSDAFKVECTTLNDLVKWAGIQEYVLICDIEGAEIDILLNQNDGLAYCTLLIIEVHSVTRNGRAYEPVDLIQR